MTDVNTQADQEEQVAKIVDAHIRGLKMQLRQLSKKQLVAMCINLTVRLYQIETEKKAQNETVD